MDKYWKMAILKAIGLVGAYIFTWLAAIYFIAHTPSSALFWGLVACACGIWWLAYPMVAFARAKDALAKIENLTNQKENP